MSTPRPDRNLALELVRVTEAAAMGAGRWIGRGDKIAADQGAVDAMREMLDTVVMAGVVVIGELRQAGARVNLIRDGDVAPAIAAARPETGVDLLYGIGGTPEGVISAAALKCVGGGIQGKLWPRTPEERQALIDQGYDLGRVLFTNDLVTGEDVFVAATGVTTGALLRGVRYVNDGAITDSIVMRSRSGTVRRIEARHQLSKLAHFTGREY